MKQVHYETEQSLNRVMAQIRAPEDEQVKILRKHLTGETPEKIVVLDENGNQRIIPLMDVILISVISKTLYVHTQKKCYYIRYPLVRLHAELDSEVFIRISRYELVNIRKITACDFTPERAFHLSLEGGYDAWASRRYIPRIRKLITDYLASHPRQPAVPPKEKIIVYRLRRAMPGKR